MTERNYTVGYGKPPVHSQFKKGESGFRGRKHKLKVQSAADLIDSALSELVSVVESGKTIKITKLELFIRQFLARAINGDRQASKLLLEHLYGRKVETAAQAESVTDTFLIAELMRMMGEVGGEAGDVPV